MAQSQVIGGHGSSGDDDSDLGGGQASLHASVEETDDLLDEIDSMLDTNAEQFVLSFIQKGGQ